MLTDFSQCKREQTQALQAMVYGDQPSGRFGRGAVSPAPSMTLEQKLAQLDKLVAEGYITPA